MEYPLLLLLWIDARDDVATITVLINMIAIKIHIVRQCVIQNLTDPFTLLQNCMSLLKW
jgi:hypothetical protein